MHIDFEVSRFQTGYYEENLCASGVWPCCDIIYWGYNLKISFEGLSLSLSLSSFWIFQRKGNRTNFRRTTTWWRTCRVWSRLSLVCLYLMGTAIMWLVSIKFKTIGLDWSVNITRSLIKIPKDKRNWLLNAIWTTEKP